MRSRFPIDRRPIYLLPGARVDFRTMQRPDALASWAHAIADFCDLRTDRSGIIHTVSYDRAEQIEALVDFGARLVLIHHRGTPAAAIVARFKAAPRGTILVSPSVMTGFDFPHTECEFIIIVNLPIPDTRPKPAPPPLPATTLHPPTH